MIRKNNPATTDPFEQAFFDYLEGDYKAELVVYTNKGEPEILPVAYFFRTHSEMPDLEKEALKACQGKILDIGAGAGPHSLYLQTKDFDVAALEIRAGFVEVMKRRGIKKVFLSDIEDFQEGRYDTLLLLMNGIGFTKNIAGVERFLEKAKRLLRPGGQILLDSTDLLYLYQQEDGTVKIDLNNAYYGEVEYRIEYEGKMGDPFLWLYIDYSTLSFYAEKAGFRCEMMMETELFNYLARLYV
jgi:SAM-dependent methyltransferase